MRRGKARRTAIVCVTSVLCTLWSSSVVLPHVLTAIAAERSVTLAWLCRTLCLQLLSSGAAAATVRYVGSSRLVLILIRQVTLFVGKVTRSCGKHWLYAGGTRGNASQLIRSIFVTSSCHNNGLSHRPSPHIPILHACKVF